MESINYINACLLCIASCEKCISESIKSGNQQCIIACRECVDICYICATFEIRDSKYSNELRVLCSKICTICIAECSKHAHTHQECKDCAEACKQCLEAAA